MLGAALRDARSGCEMHRRAGQADACWYCGFDEQLAFVSQTDVPLAHADYRLSVSNGETWTGTTDAQGRTGRVSSKQLAIKHRLITPRHPQTNGMVERFNGSISEVVNQTSFPCRAERESTLRNYLKIYSHNIPQCALNNETPIQAMKKWQAKKPESFVKRVYNQVGLDS